MGGRSSGGACRPHIRAIRSGSVITILLIYASYDFVARLPTSKSGLADNSWIGGCMTSADTHAMLSCQSYMKAEARQFYDGPHGVILGQ